MSCVIGPLTYVVMSRICCSEFSWCIDKNVPIRFRSIQITRHPYSTDLPWWRWFPRSFQDAESGLGIPFSSPTSVRIQNSWYGAPRMSVVRLSEGVSDGRSSREVMRHVSFSDGVYQYHVFCDCCRAGETVCVDSDHLFSVVNRFTFAKVVSSSPFTRRGNGVFPETPLTKAATRCGL